jgi:putative ABC transport system permease protein
MIGHYLNTALHAFRRAPFLTAVNVVTLALGLVCFVTAYALVDYWQKSERYFDKADRTAVITRGLEFHDGSVTVSPVPFVAMHVAGYLKADFPEIETVARAQRAPDTAISYGDRSIRITRLLVDPEFLDVFDLPFVAGDPAEALRKPSSIVVTEETAQRLFGSDNPIGKSVVIANQVDATVTGVVAPVPEPSHLSRSAAAPMHFDLLASWNIFGEIQTTRNPDRSWPPPENWIGACCVTYVVLPADGSLTASELDAELADFAKRHIPPEQAEVADIQMGALPLSGLTVATMDATLFQGMKGYVSITSLLLLLGGLILAVACVNYSNLAAAGAVRRAREIGLRKVVGAGRRQVMLQYLLEAGLQTAAAVALAALSLVLIVPALAAGVGIDLAASLLAGPSFWVFLIALVGVVTLAAGTYPAFVLSRVRPVQALRVGRVRAGPRFVATLLVGAQFAAASFLLIAVIVMFSQNSELRRTGLGIGRDPLLMIDNPARLTGVEEQTLRAELLRLPQVEGVTGVAQRPWSMGTPIGLVSRSEDPGAATHKVFQNWVGQDYFSVFDMSVLAGRAFDPDRAEDDSSGAIQQQQTINVVVDQAFVDEMGFATPQAAIDELVYFPADINKAFGGGGIQPLRIIGVVENKPLHFVGLGATSNMYRFIQQTENQIARLSASDVSGGVASIEGLWKRLSPHMPLGRHFVDDMFNESYQSFARINEVFVGLSLFAFFIATIGLFSMAIQVANRRIHEIGVRKTLGASTRQVVWMLLSDFGRPVLVANLIAWPLAFVVAKIYLGLFIHRIALTPVPFVLSLVVTVGIAWAAVGAQAYRAARVQPANVLRSE